MKPARAGSMIIVANKTLQRIAIEKLAICLLYFVIGLLSRPWVEGLIRRYWE